MDQKSVYVSKLNTMTQKTQEKIQEKYELANKYLLSGDYDMALLQYEKVQFMSPKDPDVFLGKGKIYMALGDLKSTMSNLRKYVRLHLDPAQKNKDLLAEVLDVHGYQLMLSGDYQGSLSYFAESIANNALSSNVWLHRGLAYIGLERWIKALQDLDHCLKLNADDADVYLLRAKLHWKLQLRDKGNADVSRAFQINPEHKEVRRLEVNMWQESHVALKEASIYLLTKDYKKALKKLNTAVDACPEDLQALIFRASTYRELGEYDLALNDIEKATEYYKRCHTTTPLEKKKDSDYEENQEITRQRNLIYNDRAVQYLKNGDFTAALSLLNKAIESECLSITRAGGQPIHWKFYVNRGDAYRSLNKLQSAIADYHSALDIEPQQMEIHTRVAMVHFTMGVQYFNDHRYAQAEVEFTRAITYNPKVPKFYVYRAEAWKYQTKSSEAYQDYQTALLLDPNDATVQEKLQQYACSESSSLPNRLSKLPTIEQKSRIKANDQLSKMGRSYKKKNMMVKSLLENNLQLRRPTYLR